jgi:hypothetical protein
MAGFDDADALGRQAVLVARHGYAIQGSGPISFDRERHRGGRFAGSSDEGAAFGRRRQVRAENLQRIGRRDGGAEALFEKRPQPKLSFAASLPRP